MSGEGLRVQVERFLQFWRNSVMIVVLRCHEFVFSASADSQEQVENRPHCLTSDGGTASPSNAASSDEGGWEEITTALTAKSSAPRELQISKNIDPAGEFKVPLALASQSTAAAASVPSAQCRIPPQRRSLEDSKEQSIIISAQRTPRPVVQDVKIGNEVLVVNTSVVNIESDQIESLNKDHVRMKVDALYEDRFRELGKPELDNAAAGGLRVKARPSRRPYSCAAVRL